MKTTRVGRRVPGRIPFAVITAISAASLALTACGGGDDDGGDPIDGAEQGDDADASDEPSDDTSTTPAPANRPEVVLPDSINNVFEDWESGDAREQAVLDDGRRRIEARDLAIVEQDPEADYFDFYNDAQALQIGQDWLQEFVDNGVGIEGTVRYLDPQVSFNEDVATLVYCADESEARSYNIENGEEVEGPSVPQYVYTTHLEENEEGVWVTVSVASDERECVT
jgi:hypothetical protein